jgi:hypothetical protein
MRAKCPNNLIVTSGYCRFLVVGENVHSRQLLLKKRREQLKSTSELLYDWRFTAKLFRLAAKPLEFTARDYYFFAAEPLQP